MTFHLPHKCVKTKCTYKKEWVFFSLFVCFNLHEYKDLHGCGNMFHVVCAVGRGGKSTGCLYLSRTTKKNPPVKVLKQLLYSSEVLKVRKQKVAPDSNIFL